jgi:aquaporin Z
VVFVFGLALTTHSWFAPLLVAMPLAAMVAPNTRLPRAYGNPVLTLAMLTSRRIGKRCAAALWLVQLGAGLLAAAVVRVIVDPSRLEATAATVPVGVLVTALAVETFVACLLCHVTVDVSGTRSPTADDHPAWPIIFVVAAGAVMVGAITYCALRLGAGFDGAAPSIVSWPTLWVYLASGLLSGLAATISFLVVGEHR